MAEPKATKKQEEFDMDAYMKELVPFYAFKDAGKYKDDIVTAVNGRNFVIKRGEQVMIPRYVYEVLVHSMEQDNATADLIAAQREEFARSRDALI